MTGSTTRPEGCQRLGGIGVQQIMGPKTWLAVNRRQRRLALGDLVDRPLAA
jgi:hypothetical protein